MPPDAARRRPPKAPHLSRAVSVADAARARTIIMCAFARAAIAYVVAGAAAITAVFFGAVSYVRMQGE